MLTAKNVFMGRVFFSQIYLLLDLNFDEGGKMQKHVNLQSNNYCLSFMMNNVAFGVLVMINMNWKHEIFQLIQIQVMVISCREHQKCISI